MAQSFTYSFLDVAAAVSGPGGSFDIGAGTGLAKEGITIAMIEPKASMTIGADGSYMHSLHAGKGGTIAFRFLKTAPVNAILSQMYVFETSSSANYGQDLITIRNPVRGDTVLARGCGIAKFPDNVYAEEGPMLEWMFNCGMIDQILGSGSPG